MKRPAPLLGAALDEVVVEDIVLAAEAVFDGIEARSGLALDGLGPGRFEGILAIGFEAAITDHRRRLRFG